VSKPLVSVILTVLNEVDNLPLMHQELVRLTVQEPEFDWEFLFVDDGSTDGSLACLRDLHAHDARVKVIRLVRNFGSHEATSAALRACAGDVAVLMAADLQDPPELVREFLRHWQTGHDVVLGVRASREDKGWRRWSAGLFTWLVRRVTLPEFPKNGTGGYCLISRRVITAYNTIGERNRLTTGLLVWLGFPRVDVEYHRRKRHSGQSKFGLYRLVKTAMDMFVAFSSAPVQFITLIGVLTFLAGLAGGVSLFAAALIFGASVSAWAPLVAMLLLGGLQFLALGILGEYQWRTLAEVRGRPEYVVREWIGEFSHAKCDDDHSPSRAA
jgi:polyisoprenyl-phosphate glycosyltransferase